jgi:hypothetical protein
MYVPWVETQSSKLSDHHRLIQNSPHCDYQSRFKLASSAGGSKDIIKIQERRDSTLRIWMADRQQEL